MRHDLAERRGLKTRNPLRAHLHVDLLGEHSWDGVASLDAACLSDIECLVSESCLDQGSALQIMDLLSVPHTIFGFTECIGLKVVFGRHLAKC
jgi:hypothetical protein